MDPLEAQRELLEIVIELQRLDQRLHQLAADLPLAAEQEHMLEDRIPRDVATELYATITFGQTDHLRPLIAGLAAATKVTGEYLSHSFRKLRVAEAEDPAPQPHQAPDAERPEADA